MALGQAHILCGVREALVDRDQRIVTTPAYMLAQSLSEAYVGIEKLVSEALAFVPQPVR